MLKNRLNLYTIKSLGGVAMKKTQQQTLAQAVQQQTLAQEHQGGEAMKERAQQGIYFVTFTNRVSPEEAKKVLTELHKRFPSQIPIFTPRPPKGKKFVIYVNELMVIITFPYTPKKPNMQEQAPQNQEQGFTLGQLIKNKRT